MMTATRVVIGDTRRLCRRRVSHWSPRSDNFLWLSFRGYWLQLFGTRVFASSHPYKTYGVVYAARGPGRDDEVLYRFAEGYWDMKKILLGGASPDDKAPRSSASQTSKVFSKHVNLIAHCSVTRYDDGSPRRPGWWTLKTLGSSWVVQIKDPDACASLTVTAQSLDDALGLADAMISAETAPWEPDQFLEAGRKPKKKG